MKYLILLLISFPALADITYEAAYQRERTYLTTQKEALLRIKNQLSSSLSERKLKAEREITLKQNEFSQLQLQNQELHEQFKAIEKITKESSQMAGQLEKNALKIQEQHSLLRSKLGLIGPVAPSEKDPVKKFEQLLSEGLSLVATLSRRDWRPHAFLDENEHLMQGEVLFIGLFAALGKAQGKLFTLAPYNDQFLKVIAPNQGHDFYFFNPNFERTGLKAAKTWKESIADAIPGIVMLIIMAAVLGLFILLARA